MNLHPRQSRRQFIKGTLATAGALGLATTSGQPETRESSQIDSDALKRFRAKLKGGLILPRTPVMRPWVASFFGTPTRRGDPPLVARCAHTDDVRYAVEFAREHGLEVAVRGGGHSPMGWGTSNGLVIDLAGKGAAEAVFGRNHSRLVALKNKYDPTNFFRRNSNVEPRQA
jgi:FAD/FMN-containing dehydrogenase